jgi:SAM-dependent methyltransferase
LPASERLDAAGKRFARLVTDAVVARPRLWRLFRRPLQAQFDWLAPHWEGNRSPHHLAPLEDALERLDAHPCRALDLGTGTGLAARLVARRFPDADVVGVDLSPGMVDEARRRLPLDLAERVRFQVADASALPFEDGAFDLVTLLNMIPFFEELARVTAPGGTILLASSYGAETPIYVPPQTLRARLGALGFEGFREFRAGEGTAFVATARR